MPSDSRHPLPFRWLAAIVLACAVSAAITWWFVGKRVWTDGGNIRLPQSAARARIVIWAPPEPLAGVINTSEDEAQPCLSPDGNELYFVRGRPGHNAKIYVCYRRAGAWTEPAPLAAVNGQSDDLCPRLTPDGRILIFSSDRPGGSGGYDLWASERTADGWGKPYNLGPEINSASDEYGAAFTPDMRAMYFSSNRRASGDGGLRSATRATSISTSPKSRNFTCRPARARQAESQRPPWFSARSMKSRPCAAGHMTGPAASPRPGISCISHQIAPAASAALISGAAG